MGIILIAAGIRGLMLNRDVRLHGDESLYASYARAMSVHGDWLLQQSGVPTPLDKPPLGLALTAAGFSLFGVSEFAGRLITVLVSVCSAAAVYALVRRLYNAPTAMLTTLLLALCPFDIAFAATLFHDPALTLWLVLVSLMLASRRAGAAGLCAAAAVATKQSALQFLPVYVLIGAAAAPPARFRWHTAARFAAGAGVGLAALLGWGVVRAAPVDFWTTGITNPGLLRVIRPDELIPRLLRWGELLGKVTGFAPLLLIALMPVLLSVTVNKPPTSADQQRTAMLDSVVAIGVLTTLLLYWLLAYNLYDRYLLPLVPLLLCLLVRGLLHLPRKISTAMILLVVVFMALTIGDNRRGSYGVGNDAESVRGIDHFAARVAILPANALIHHFWLDWQLGFYMGDPLTKALPTLLFQPSPEALLRFQDTAQSVQFGAQYLALPAAFAPRWERRLAEIDRRVVLRRMYRDDNYILYEVELVR